jgi:SAM-dependent methyltransferase
MVVTAVEPPVVRLLNAPKVEWAKHRSQARPALRRLVRSWFLTGKWHYFFFLLSETGYLLSREKYSAFAIDRVYADQPGGWGWLGRRLDRYILDLPVHRAVRDRFTFVTRSLAAAIRSQLADGTDRVAVLSAPCGLTRDLCTAYEMVRREAPDAGRRLRLYGLDLDFEGRVLEEAHRRAGAAGVPVRLVQADVLDDTTWSWLGEQDGPFAVMNCIGLAPWLSPEELAGLLRRFAAHLRPGGYVLLDRFNRGKHDKLGEGAEIHAHYHTDAAYRDYFEASGLTLQECEPLGDGEGMGYLLRKCG